MSASQVGHEPNTVDTALQVSLWLGRDLNDRDATVTWPSHVTNHVKTIIAMTLQILSEVIHFQKQHVCPNVCWVPGGFEGPREGLP